MPRNAKKCQDIRRGLDPIHLIKLHIARLGVLTTPAERSHLAESGNEGQIVGCLTATRATHSPTLPQFGLSRLDFLGTCEGTPMALKPLCTANLQTCAFRSARERGRRSSQKRPGPGLAPDVAVAPHYQQSLPGLRLVAVALLQLSLGLDPPGNLESWAEGGSSPSA